MEMHRLVALLVSLAFQEPGALALDLNSTPSLILDVFHVRATLADDLSAEIESADRFEVDGDLFFKPLAL